MPTTTPPPNLPPAVSRANVKGIIFDCDGVIIDSSAANTAFYNRIRACFDLPPMTPEQEAYTHMATVHQSLAEVIPQEFHPQLYDVCRTKVNYSRDILPMIVLEEGLLEFVRWLRDAGIRAAVDTNRFDGMPPLLERFQIGAYFDPVVTAAIVPPKPAPDGVYHVQQAWGMAAEELLFIGDSLMDAETAANAGVRFVAYKNPELSACLHIGAFSQLQALLQA